MPEAGFDFKALPALSTGFFVAVSVGEYFAARALERESSDIVQSWVFTGWRATYDLHL
jgi:hypothetical protein